MTSTGTHPEICASRRWSSHANEIAQTIEMHSRAAGRCHPETVRAGFGRSVGWGGVLCRPGTSFCNEPRKRELHGLGNYLIRGNGANPVWYVS